MNVPTAQTWHNPAPVAPPAGRGPDRGRRPAEEHDAGCGWFESSHDLAHGLLVCEHAALAGVPGAGLSVADWLALQRAGWPAPPLAA